MSRRARCLLPSMSLLLACRVTAVDMPEPPPATVDAVLPGGERQAAPGTVDPTGTPAEVSPGTYEPAADPRNSKGWDLANKRSPDDPDDARKAAFSIEALYRLASIGGPHWSPDGNHLLFTVTRHELAKGTSNTDLWLADSSGGEPRQLTHHAAYDGAPTWAPDGRSFAFVSRREDGAQLWRMSIDGGEAERLTAVATGVIEPRWSPDGTHIAFGSRVFPEHGADDAANRAQLDDLADNPIKAHVADELLYRHWTRWDDGRREHLLVLDLATDEIVDVTPGEHDSPTFRLGDPGYAFSPDGSEICFVSNRDPAPAQATSTNKDLFVVPTTGGKARALTADNPGFDGHPLYSPDGRFIAFRRQAQPGYESDAFELALYDREQGTVRLLTEAFPNWVTDMRWAADSGSLVFQGPVAGRTPLHRVSIDGGAIETLGLPSARGWDLSPTGRLAFTFSTVGRPVEMFVADAGGARPRRLTGLNDPVVDAYDVRPVEEQWIPGADGKPVHVFVVKPHGYRKGKRYPLIINVHGGPQSQWADYLRGDWQVYPGAGYVVAFFNPHGSTGYGQDYTAAISKDWGGKVYKDVMAVVDALEQEPYVDPERVGAMGWSYGGYMMNWLLGHTDRFEAIASMMGIYDLPSFHGATEELWFPEWDLGGPPWTQRNAYRTWSPSTYSEKFVTPTLVITGERDYRVPYTQSLDLFTALRRQDVPARLVVFPNDGHWPSHVRSMPLYYAAHLDWFHRYLGGDPSPYDLDAMVRGRAFRADD